VKRLISIRLIYPHIHGGDGEGGVGRSQWCRRPEQQGGRGGKLGDKINLSNEKKKTISLS
jgi:hypothetical protein